MIQKQKLHLFHFKLQLLLLFKMHLFFSILYTCLKNRNEYITFYGVRLKPKEGGFYAKINLILNRME